jgi:hypothetical protein
MEENQINSVPFIAKLANSQAALAANGREINTRFQKKILEPVNESKAFANEVTRIGPPKRRCPDSISGPMRWKAMHQKRIDLTLSFPTPRRSMASGASKMLGSSKTASRPFFSHPYRGQNVSCRAKNPSDNGFSKVLNVEDDARVSCLVNPFLVIVIR